jgi:hypothetical protein
MAGHDELARLESERDRLRSVVAYYNGPLNRMPWGEGRAPEWLVVAVVVVVCGIAVALLAGIAAGQVSPWGLVLILIGLPVLAVIFSRVGFLTFDVGDTVIVIPYLSWRPVGEGEARARLAECETRIAKLRGDAARD